MIYKMSKMNSSALKQNLICICFLFPELSLWPNNPIYWQSIWSYVYKYIYTVDYRNRFKHYEVFFALVLKMPWQIYMISVIMILCEQTRCPNMLAAAGGSLVTENCCWWSLLPLLQCQPKDFCPLSVLVYTSNPLLNVNQNKRIALPEACRCLCCTLAAWTRGGQSRVLWLDIDPLLFAGLKMKWSFL